MGNGDKGLPQRLREACDECLPADGLGSKFTIVLLDGSGEGSYGDRLVKLAREAADALEAPHCVVTDAACDIGCKDALKCERLKAQPSHEVPRLWLWQNFVDGKPEYWAYDNPYPCHPNGDPLTLGEPCGYADFKPSTRGRADVSEAEVIAAIKRGLAHAG